METNRPPLSDPDARTAPDASIGSPDASTGSPDASLAGTETGLVAVVAVNASGVIGREGSIPWQLSSDLRRFKRLTMGGTLIMGPANL